MNLTQSQLEYLETATSTGGEVSSVAYNPGTVTGDPESAAVADG